MRKVLADFAATLPGIASVMIPISFMITLFALVGMELFAGRLHRCTCPTDTR